MELLNPVAYGLSAGLAISPTVAPAARSHPRARAGRRSFAFPSMVMGLPKEVPKSAASSPQRTR
jgi:hypothetical protein